MARLASFPKAHTTYSYLCTHLLNEEEVFDSDFASTDEEAAQEDEAAAEKDIVAEERQARRVCFFSISIANSTKMFELLLVREAAHIQGCRSSNRNATSSHERNWSNSVHE